MNTIDWVIENQETRYFMFTDPSFSERRKFVKAILQYSDRKGSYDIEWYCEGRADMPIEQLKLMRQAGCISIDFAVGIGVRRSAQDH